RSISSSPKARQSTADDPGFRHRRKLCEGCAASEEVAMRRFTLYAFIGLSAFAAAAPAAEKLEQPKVTIAVGGRSLFYYLPLTLDGLPPDAVSIIGVGASSGAVAAMQKGQIDGISNLDPVITRLEKGGDIVAVVDTRTPQGMKDVYGGAYAAGCLYARTEFLRKNPNTAAALASAMVRALLWLQKATPDQVVGTVPAEYYGGDKELYKAALLQDKD